MKKIIAALALGSAAFGGAAVSAQPIEHTQATIKYDDLNLGSNEGVEILEQRIAEAAREVCNVGAARTGSRMKSQHAAKCVKKFKANAMNQFAAVIEQQRRGG